MRRQQQIADLAWAGQHEKAIAAATAALKRKTARRRRAHGAAGPARGELHRRRRLKRAAADAQAMKALAKREGDAALQARALCRESFVQTRQGEMRAAVASATAALKAARKSRQPELEALSLLRLARAQVAAGSIIGRRAGERRARGHAVRGAGRHRPPGPRTAVPEPAFSGLDQSADSAQTSAEALALARRCGDLFGQGDALNCSHLRGRYRRAPASVAARRSTHSGRRAMCWPGDGNGQPRQQLCRSGPVSARTAPDARSRGHQPPRRGQWRACWSGPGTSPSGVPGGSLDDARAFGAEADRPDPHAARQALLRASSRSPRDGSPCARAAPPRPRAASSARPRQAASRRNRRAASGADRSRRGPISPPGNPPPPWRPRAAPPRCTAPWIWRRSTR